MNPSCALPTKPTFLEIDHIDRVFPTKQGDYIAIKDVYLKVEEGEFVCIVGHSGCGKSTILNILAGLDRASAGGIVLDGKEVHDPGPDRMVVFQNHSLLPWLTVRQNIALGVNRVFKHLRKPERARIVEEHIQIVGLSHAADKYPREISGGMKQRVGIARALALRPRLLLLDEPFGALDALTRGRLQEKLMEICNQYRISAVMITHDVDEALLLSDRIVLMTNGPSANVGKILEVDMPRPRQRMDVVNHPSYYRIRSEVVEFLDRQKKVKAERTKRQQVAAISRGNIEKTNLAIGFIPLTDCAPFAIALEKGIFAKHGLEVALTRESSWNSIAEGIREGRLDAAQMVTGMPLALTMGLGNQPPLPTIASLTLSRNGNAITLSKFLYEAGVRDLATLKQFIDRNKDKKPLTFGMVHPASMHNLMLRHWLASGGIDPNRDVEIIVIPPPQMVSNLIAGNIAGYCVGEPWNSRAVQEENAGFIVATDLDIWPNHPEKVLGVREDWAEQYPNTHLALVKALLEACQFCQSGDNRDEALGVISQPQYLNLHPLFVRPGFAGPLRTGRGKSLYLTNFNQFLLDNMPRMDEQTWILAQMARWGIAPFPESYQELLNRVVQPSVYRQAAEDLEIPIAPASMAPITLADGSTFDPTAPVQAIAHAKFSQFAANTQLVENGVL
ncbi:nitrate ABC transporter ATP-binding protein [Pseudanabaena sp. PCC 6802]|uniref:ABC transporter ATP-binding/substrate-binding protein n=1 Tax=Pseudanabaena sp. PCC 6802 TaxID=118173 RepID=UPI000344F6CD|nr:nitrate ABC transporter ATP-binding protein [Pseudanabaena sp. PCC 6802]